jgi:arylsulfatase A-like enzyme/Flp pilus assembly protein TadD
LWLPLGLLLCVATLFVRGITPDHSQINNIVLISIDTCRADHLSCYGYPFETTPNIDAIAREGVRFEQAYANVPLTLPSHSSIMTGTNPPFHGVHANTAGRLADINLTLAEILNEIGWRTSAIVSAFVLDSQFGLDQGFQDYNDQFEKRMDNESVTQRNGGEVTRHALEWLRNRRESPFFLFLHYFDPHHSYSPPQPFASRFSSSAYAAEIAYTDHCIGQVVSGLKKQNLYDSTLIIITSDHGEALGEHGEDTHGYFVYQGTIHVPLIIRIPGTSTPKVIADAVDLTDIMPTILSLLDKEIPDHVTGHDLSDYLLSDDPKQKPREHYCESLEPENYECTGFRSLISGQWKYIHSAKPELYNLATDPKEVENLAGVKTEKAKELGKRLKQILKAQTRDNLDAGQQSLDAMSIAKLEALGYIAGKKPGDKAGSKAGNNAPQDFYPIYKKYMRAKGFHLEKALERARALAADLVSEHPEKTVFSSLLCQVLTEQENIPEATRQCLDSVRADPDDSEAHNALGKVYLNQGNFEKSGLHFRKSIELRPYDINFRMDFALGLAAQERLEEAETVFLSILEYNANDAMVLTNFGICLAQQKKFKQAVVRFGEALQYSPTNQQARESLAMTLSILGDFDGALAHYGEAIRNNPQSIKAHVLSAQILEHKNRWNEARELYEKALLISPGDERITGRLSAVKERLGQAEQAN